MAFCWTWSRKSKSVSYWWAQKWTQHARCGPTSAEYTAEITYLLAPNAAQDIIGVFIATGVHCWFRSSLQSCFPASGPQCVLLPGMIPLCVWDSVLSLQEIHLCPVLLPKSLNSGRHNRLVYQPLLSFISSVSLQRVDSAPSLMRVLNSIGQYWASWPLGICLQLDLGPQIINLWTCSFSYLLIHIHSPLFWSIFCQLVHDDITGFDFEVFI